MQEESLKVFISYSWDSEAHKQWVLNFAGKLLSDGVDVFLDIYELSLGKNLTAFIEHAIKESDRIIIFFTPNYKLKADNRSGGVGYEYSIINSNIYKDIIHQEKLIPVLRSGTPDDSIPDFIKQFIYLDMSNDQGFDHNYERLLREIYREVIKKPPLGKKPVFRMEDKPILSPVKVDDESLKVLKGKMVDLEDQLEKFRQTKNIVIRNLKYEEGAALRDQEKRIMEELDDVKMTFHLEELKQMQRSHETGPSLKGLKVKMANYEQQLAKIKEIKDIVIATKKYAEGAILRDEEKRIRDKLRDVQMDFQLDELMQAHDEAVANQKFGVAAVLSERIKDLITEMEEHASFDFSFSDKLKEIIAYSRTEAIRLGNGFIGTRHLLLSIISKENGPAVSALQTLHIDLGVLRKKLESTIYEKDSRTWTGQNSLPLTKEAEKCVRVAVVEAKAGRNAAPGVIHLMLGMLKYGESEAGRILYDLGVNYGIFKNLTSQR